MSLAPSIKIWDVNGCLGFRVLGCERWNRRGNNEQPMRASQCICPWVEEANAFALMTWKGIDWLRWLSDRMANMMINRRFLMHFRKRWRDNCEFKCQSDEKAFDWLKNCKTTTMHIALLRAFQWYHNEGPYSSGGLSCGHKQSKTNIYLNI